MRRNGALTFLPLLARPGAIVFVCLLLLSAPLLRAQDVAALVRDAAYNEVHSHTEGGGWEYRVDKRVDGQLLTEEQVETGQGPVHRLIAFNGKPLSAHQQQQEDERIRELLRHPQLQQKAEKEYRSDEKTLLSLLGELPDAFLFEAKAREGDNQVLAFRPNPAMHESGYVGRVMQAMQGELVVNLREKRIVSFSGHLFEKVEFGYGLLGKLNPGGTFLVERVEPAPGTWKTSLVRINISGRFSFFATIAKQEDEKHTEFRQVPSGMTAAEGYRLLGITK